MVSTFLYWISILIFLSAITVSCSPFDPLSGKTGEDQVKEAVRQAELAAGRAALQSEKHGHSAELRVAAIKAKLAAQNAVKQQIRKMRKEHGKVKPLRKWGHLLNLHHKMKPYEGQHLMPRHHFRLPSHRKHYSNMISLDDLTSDNKAQSNGYEEDTTLEDRLALEAEEDKKYGGLSESSSRSFLDQDATQSIQNQVASESAKELKEIQQQINAESQNSLGKTTIGQAAAVLQGDATRQPMMQQKASARNGMMDVQSDLNNAFSNAEGMNTESGIASPQDNSNADNNNIGANSFTGLGEETQPNNFGMQDMSGISSLTNNGGQSEQSEIMGQGTASTEGQQETAQSAMSALAAGGGASLSGSQPQIPNDIGGLGGPGASLEENAEQSQGLQGFNANNFGGSRMAEAKMLTDTGAGNPFGGSTMKKSNIHNQN